jgi:hypothetical protein
MNLLIHGAVVLNRKKWIYIILSYQILPLVAFTDYVPEYISWVKVNRFEDVRQFINTVYSMSG